MHFVNKLGKNVEMHAQDSSAKFWKALLLKGCDLIDKVPSGNCNNFLFLNLLLCFYGSDIF